MVAFLKDTICSLKWFSNLAQKGGIILFIEIRLIVGEGGIEIFPQHYRGYLKKSRFTEGGGGGMEKKEFLTYPPLP